MWTNKAKSTKAKGKAVEKKVANRDPRPKCFPKAPIVPIRRLMPTDTMDISSGSEFEPEDDEEAVDEDVEEEDEEERQAWAAFVAARAARKNKNKVRAHPASSMLTASHDLTPSTGSSSFTYCARTSRGMS